MSLSEYPLWVRQNTYYGFDVVGESHYTKTIRKIVGRAWTGDQGEVEVILQLVPEPDNPHGTTSISVRHNMAVLGYIPTGESANYWPHIARIAASGLVATVPGRVWAGNRLDWDNWNGRGQPRTKLIGSVRLALGEPNTCVPLNDPPIAPHAFLPDGPTIQVTKEENHFDVLGDFVPSSGQGRLIVTLHRADRATTRSTKSVVEIRVDDEHIGELTPASSMKFLAVIDHFASRGLVTAARATIKGSSVAAQVTLQAAQSHGLDEEILHGAAAAIPTLVSFSPDAADYDVPAAFRRDGTTERSRPRAQTTVTSAPSPHPEPTTTSTPPPAPIPAASQNMDTPVAYVQSNPARTVGAPLPGALPPLQRTPPPAPVAPKPAAPRLRALTPDEKAANQRANMLRSLTLLGLMFGGFFAVLIPYVGPFVWLAAWGFAVFFTIKWVQAWRQDRGARRIHDAGTPG